MDKDKGKGPEETKGLLSNDVESKKHLRIIFAVSFLWAPINRQQTRKEHEKDFEVLVRKNKQ